MLPEVVVQCPAYKPGYDAATSKKLGQELADLRSRNPGAVTPSIVRDYAVMLAECRAQDKNILKK